MALFPPTTNADYQGSQVSAWFLFVAGLAEFVPGLIHFFLPDGGAGVIAGIDLSERGDLIVALFAWFGAIQIPSALLIIIIALRYRTLVPLGLLWIILARGLMTYDGWLGKASEGGHHPPEHYASPVAVVVAAIFLVLSLRKRAPG
ncbi:MAG: hypothetical protein KGS00_10580 [Alphaproteobacteria bacterium]|nr:hypothetical protein [Alphaproteobacteria bacterium]